jgi:hypothetical protein
VVAIIVCTPSLPLHFSSQLRIWRGTVSVSLAISSQNPH